MFKDGDDVDATGTIGVVFDRDFTLPSDSGVSGLVLRLACRIGRLSVEGERRRPCCATTASIDPKLRCLEVEAGGVNGGEVAN
jgi:hypothetical protein